MTDIKTKCREQEHVQMQPVPSYSKPKDIWTSSHLNHMLKEQPMTSFIKYQNLDQVLVPLPATYTPLFP